MSAYVNLSHRKNRGWPWPEDSFGLTSMYGPEGWCRKCGIPRQPQVGPLVLQRKGIRVEGAWVPNWRHDMRCVSGELAAEVESRFGVELRPLAWHPHSAGDAFQIVIPVVGEAWFDPSALRAAAVKRHGVEGQTCEECGTWRWRPLNLSMTPPLEIGREWADLPIVASPEWFGDGWKSYHLVAVRKDLAEYLAAKSPRDFQVKGLA